MADIGDRIKTARGSLTQEAFAELLGYDKSTVASWEIGRREPDIKVLKRIADMAGVNLDWLAGGYDCDIEKARVYNNPVWREIIDIAAENIIRPELIKPVIDAIVAIKKA